MSYASQTLLERIKREGSIDGDVIKVDRFLNHMVDPQLIDLLATDIATYYAEKSIEKVLTAETSGIMLAQAVAGMLGVSFVYAKKKLPLTMGPHYAAASYSYTKKESTTLYIAKEVLRPRERVLFIDDFLAKGSTLKAIEEIVEQAEAMLVGSAVIINKSQRRDIYSILTLDQLRT